MVLIFDPHKGVSVIILNAIAATHLHGCPASSVLGRKKVSTTPSPSPIGNNVNANINDIHDMFVFNKNKQTNNNIRLGGSKLKAC